MKEREDEREREMSNESKHDLCSVFLIFEVLSVRFSH